MSRCLILTATLALACNGAPQQNPIGDAGVVVVDAAPPASALSDAQVFGVLHAINAGEAAEGRVARESAVRPDVVSFADKMVTDHTSADAALTQSGIAPAESTLSQKVHDGATRDLTALQRTRGASFDVTYVTIQVGDHQTALALIDMLLSRSASNPVVLAQLQASRDLVTDHMAHANALSEAVSQ